MIVGSIKFNLRNNEGVRALRLATQHEDLASVIRELHELLCRIYNCKEPGCSESDSALAEKLIQEFNRIIEDYGILFSDLF